MAKRIPLTAPWWSSLRQEETNIFLEREPSTEGDTAYGVYNDTERIGHVYSVKHEAKVEWFAVPGVSPHEDAFSDRFSAVRFVAGHIAG